MAKIISICSQKGGVGKTATAINLAAAFANYKKKTLLVDLDPSSNASKGCGVDATLLNTCIDSVLLNRINIKKSIIKRNEYLSLIPAKLSLLDVQDLVSNNEKKQFLLKEKLDSIRDNFDYVVIDCPPSLGFITYNALVASDSVIIPIQCEYFSLESITQLLALISRVQSNDNYSLNIEGFLVTMFDSKTTLSAEIYQEIRSLFKENTFSTYIPRNISIPESNSRGLPVIDYRPTSSGSFAYLSLAREIIDFDENN